MPLFSEHACVGVNFKNATVMATPSFQLDLLLMAPLFITDWETLLVLTLVSSSSFFLEGSQNLYISLHFFKFASYKGNKFELIYLLVKYMNVL